MPLNEHERARSIALTRSPAMQRLWALAARVAPLESTVLITGESGVGKEHFARWLHDSSTRVSGPFVPVNCAALPDSLLESELFGHARGAFTGAIRDRIGVFEAANGGTLFLDEVGEVSPAMQVKLLRVIQEREIRRVGETRSRAISARLIAATNRNLPAEVEGRRFREDLYYRLRVIDVHIPPLRERPEDLRELAASLLARTAARLHRPIVEYTESALSRILNYRWPGNVRELEHAIERACAVATGSVVDVEDLPESVRGDLTWSDFMHLRSSRLDPATQGTGEADSSRECSSDVRPLHELEREYILKVFARNQGSRSRTAKQLRISVATLARKLRSYGMQRPPAVPSGAAAPAHAVGRGTRSERSRMIDLK